MKKMLQMLFLGLISMSVHATSNKEVTLYNLDIVKLNNIQENSLTVSVNYPGRITGTCNIVIRPRRGDDDELFKKLADRFTFTRGGSGEIKANTSIASAIVIPLMNGTFVDFITVSTKDGRSFAENISAGFPGPYNEIGLFTGVCA